MFSLVLTVKFSPTTVLLWFSHRGGSEMHFGTMCTKQDHAVTGVLYDMRSVYEGKAWANCQICAKHGRSCPGWKQCWWSLWWRDCVGMV